MACAIGISIIEPWPMRIPETRKSYSPLVEKVYVPVKLPVPGERSVALRHSPPSRRRSTRSVSRSITTVP